MQITIRPALAADLPLLGQLFDLYRQFYEQAPDLPLAQRFLADRLDRQDSVILLAERQAGELLGFCQLYPTFCSVEVQPIYTLYDLFVLPAERKGSVGRRLLMAAEDRARADGKARMDLTTAKTNRTAQSVYESLGWVRDEVFYTYSRRISGA